MSNTITSLYNDAFAALEVISREQFGMIPAVMMDASVDRAVIGQTIRFPIAPAASSSAISAGLYAPDTGDQTIGNDTLTIDQVYRCSFRWEGVEQALLNQGAGYLTIQQQQIAQAMRTLVNQIENDLCDLSIKASRAVSSSGTNLFDGTDKLQSLANAVKILDDNGAPFDRHLVVGSDEVARMRSLTQLTNVNEAGESSFLRQGQLADLFGAKLHQSAQIYVPTAGTADSSTNTDASAYAVGDTVITLGTSGTGTIKAGDAVVFSTENTHKYVVASGDTDVSNGGTITLAAPGLVKAIPSGACTIAVENRTAEIRQNILFDRSAIILATRLPHEPVDGDAASKKLVVQDPRSGLAFEIRAYPQYHRTYYEVCIAWGVKALKPAHIALMVD